MLIYFSHSLQMLTTNGRSFPAWCDVRTRENGRRQPHEVVYSIPDKKPYDPRPFPLGTWTVGQPVRKDPLDTYLAPWFIPTDAGQRLPVWQVRGGVYVRPTDALTYDAGYGIHYSTSKTTLGCIRVGEKADLEWLANQINQAIVFKDHVFLEVRS